MDLKIENKTFIVCGSGAGFGRAIAEQLAENGAYVFAISRTNEKLETLRDKYRNKITILTGDIMEDSVQEKVLNSLAGSSISGVVVNAAGPPAGSAEEVNLNQWDEAWRNIVRWKISFVHKLLPLLKKQQYGRFLFIESVSVKEPVANLVLSNSLRPAIVGFVSTLAREIAAEGITLNILAPGYHATAAMERLFSKKADMQNISIEEARQSFESEIPVGSMGTPEEMAGLACWLLSPLSRYVTGQTITHDGGLVRSIFG